MAVSALVAAATLPATATGQQPSIHLEPARLESVVAPGLRLGPFTIANFTQRPYAMNVRPVILGQNRQGGIFVREDVPARARAARTIGVSVRSFDFPPGAARSVFGAVRRVRRGEGIYGGILFRATPRRAPGAAPQIVNVLQLNARLFLAPPASQRRRRWRVGRMFAEQDGRRRLRLLVPVTNRGNALERVDGVVTVLRPGGGVATRRPLRGFGLLPGATVDLPARLRSPRLAPGRYRLVARLRAGPRRLSAGGSMDLFGVNQVRTERARLVDLPAPRAYIGHDVTVKARFRNTGNVPFVPPARLEVRPVVGGEAGRVIDSVAMAGEAAAPGREGELEASVRLPEGTRSFDLRARLVQDGREIDARSIGVTPVERPPLTRRVADWVTDNAIVLVVALLVALVVGGVAAVRYIRRLQEAARR